jgi:hypothetical protein
MMAIAAVVVTMAAVGSGFHPADTLSTRGADSANVRVDSVAVSLTPRMAATSVAWKGALNASPRQADSDSQPPQRRRAVEHSEWYYRRLAIHRLASYTTVPLYVTEYVLGDKLFDGDAGGSTKSAHQAVATGIGVLFGVNTVTGVWNLWETRHEPAGRARRITHAALMLASEGGFVATASLAPEGESLDDDRETHRNVALASMGVSLASYLMMYLWKD